MLREEITSRVKTFFSQFEARSYKKGELILQPEDVKGVFFLEEGHVREYAISSQGIEVGLHIFVPQSYFPLMWVIADIQNRYYYEALTDVKTLNAPKEKVLTFLKDNPDVLLDVTKRAFIGLDKLTSRIEYLSFGKAYDKLVSTILYLARHFGERKDNQILITNKFTHSEMGALAGITRETTSRELERLIHNGLVVLHNQHLVIPDLEKLKNELST